MTSRIFGHYQRQDDSAGFGENKRGVSDRLVQRPSLLTHREIDGIQRHGEEMADKDVRLGV